MSKPVTKSRRRVARVVRRRPRGVKTAIARVDEAIREGIDKLKTPAEEREFAGFVTTAGATLLASAMKLPENVTGADALILFPDDPTRNLITAVSRYCAETHLSPAHVIAMLVEQVKLPPPPEPAPDTIWN